MMLNKLIVKTGRMLLAFGFAAGFVGSAQDARAGLTLIADSPMVTSSSTSVLPNVFLMMDDSGSMAWSHMPDDSGDVGSSVPMTYGYYGFRSSQCNGVFYNPNIIYSPPVNDAGTSYPNATLTGAWTNGYNTGAGTVDLSTAFKATDSGSMSGASKDTTGQAAYYYLYTGSQTKKTYYDSASTFFKECSSPFVSGNTAKITITSTSNPSTISSVTVNGVTITSGSTTSSGSGWGGGLTTNTVASNLAAKITAAGYSATASGSVITINTATMPSGSPSPVVNVASGSTVGTSVTAFAPPPPFTKVTVSATSSPSGKDETTNFANWYSYYRTRILMMKTATGLAFNPLTSSFRVGFATMNNNGGADFLNPQPFDSAQRKLWFDMLYKTAAGSGTPLLTALSNAGLMYGHKLPSNTLNKVAALDPIEYACQQNYTILTTDGFWNDNSNSDLSTPANKVGNQDNTEPRPFYDGAAVTYSMSTSQTTQTQTITAQSTSQYTQETQQLQMSTSSLQSQTSQLQQTNYQLQSQTSQLRATVSHLQSQTKTCGRYGNSWCTTWTDTSACTYSSTKRCQYNPTPTSVTGVASCTVNATTSTTSGTVWTGPTATTACNTAVTSGYASASSCNATTAPNSSGYTTQCRYAATSTTGVGTCAAVAASTGPNYTVQNPVACNTLATSAYANASSCSASSTPDGSGYTTQCLYTAWTTPVNVSSCTSVAQSPGPGFTVASATKCSTSDTTIGLTAPCTSSSSPGTNIICTEKDTGPTFVPTCNKEDASATNNWTRTLCDVQTISQDVPGASCTPVAGSSENGYLTTTCKTYPTGPTSTTTCVAAPASQANQWKSTTCSATDSKGGTSDTLADVAEYYYKTDLRTSALGNNIGALNADVADNIVPTSGLDGASWQHMTTFTLGLGAPGKMAYSSNYLSDLTGDYMSVLNGVTADPANGVCSWQTAKTVCNWPTPSVTGVPENIDDLWHAAVNGRGTYFSATDPALLTSSMTSALLGVKARNGQAAAATTSNPNVTSGDNFIFDSTFTSIEWSGELNRAQLDLTTGIPLSAIDWSAQALLDALPLASRTVYTFDSATTNTTHVKTFVWANLTAEQANFTSPHIDTLSQFCSVGPTCLTDKTLAEGENLVKFLAGDRSNEGVDVVKTKYYRQRKHLLGDIVNAEAAYVKLPMFTYSDAGYSQYISDQAARKGMVYAAANDGMLHAFYAGGATTPPEAGSGTEAWAYIPALVLPNLYKLADKNYANLHSYFVDGTPKQGDAFFKGPNDTKAVWHTILVGGLNAGGRGYYALDVTNPTSPKALWEFTDANMGYSFGNPLIAKLANGTWVVLVTSGYNNVGDGMGHLYVLNAATGAIISDIKTTAGSTDTPSGLGHIAGWVNDSMTDNTLLRVYGGDLQGNLWRFDVNGTDGAQLMVQLIDPVTKNPQPITTQPKLNLCNGVPVVYVGTGRYLDKTDLSDTEQQSFYAVKDKLDATTYTDPHGTASGFVPQSETTSTCPSKSSVCTAGESVRVNSNPGAVDWTTNNGWYVDFLDAGERDNTDPSIALGTIVFNTNVPSSSACTIGGYSYRYFLNACTGAALNSANTITTVKMANAMSTRPVVVKLPNNSLIELTRVTGTTSGTHCNNNTCADSVLYNAPGGATRRVSWRELTTDQ